MARKIFVLDTLLFILTFGSYAQPSSAFIAPATGCLKESIAISNASSAATRYVWDFCHTDLQTANLLTTTVTTLPTSGSFFYNSMKLINDNGSNVAFVSDMNGAKLYRLNFGTDWSSTSPIVDDLGNFGGLLSSPGAIDAVFDNGVWYLFIVNLFHNDVVRLTMGNGLLSAPTFSETLGNIGSSFSTPIGIKVILNGNSRLLFVSNLSNQSISVITFASSFSSTPSFVHGLTNNILVDPSGLDLISNGSNWFGLVSSFDNSGHVVLMNFGNDLLSVPSFSDIGVVSAGRQVRIAKEGLTYTGFVRSENDGVYKIYFGTDFSLPTTPAKISAYLVNTSRSMDVIKDTPSWKLFTIESTGGNLLRVDFNGDCQSSITVNYTVQTTPSNLQYSSGGNYFIELTAFDNSNVMAVSSSVIDISSFTAPDIDFTKQNDCINHNVDFTSVNQSGNISNYSWNFGDGGISSNSNPGYIYALAGTYNVGLVVTDANNCKNTIQKPIQVFNPPDANFNLPSANPICTGQNYLFTNTSTYDNGSNPIWQWNVNGTDVSASQDLTYLFNSNSDQTIILTAAIPGCSTQFTQTVSSIQNGPLLNFTSASTSCVGSTVNFTNTSTGSVLGFNWTFGDGNLSTQTNSSNSYSTNGVYNVTLSATNSAGCQNSVSKPISIYSNPQPNFSIDLPPFSCASSPSQFNDNTPALTDSNLSAWSWQFGDASSGTSQQRNPAYTYATAGDYNVSLQVTSNFGCSGSIQKMVTISPSPHAAFTNSQACVNQLTQFTDASGGSINSWQWKIQSSTVSSQNTNYTFKSSSTYPVTLTVKGSNGCLNSITKDIVVPIAPTIDFSILYPCTGNPTRFQEQSSGASDPGVSWNWDFSGGTATGNPATYTFPAARLYTVTLTTTRQSGCVYAASKNLTVIEGPIASFGVSSTAGPPPFDVSFTNTSTSADSYSWNFDDSNNSTSSEVSPSFTFNQLGSYHVTLTAGNSLNCISSYIKVIEVVVPDIDAAMTAFSLVDDPVSSSRRPFVSVANNGNIPLSNIPIDIDLGGDASLKEIISETILPGTILQKALAMQISSVQVPYVCATVNVPNDSSPDNNKQCASLLQEEVVLTPYPNPARSEFTIDWINPSAQDVHVIVFTSGGSVVFDQTVSTLIGLTRFKVPTASWASGLYMVRITAVNSEKIYRVAVIN